MWICPKCGRRFGRTNQDHYCGNAPTDVDAYVAAQNEAQQKRLMELVSLIRSVSPDASETIKWSMPCFQSARGSIQLAACKKRISVYIGAEVIEKFHDSLNGLDYKKDALYLPYDEAVPWDIISQMIKQVLISCVI